MYTLVSVIIPVYNVAPYVGASLESLCRQTYKEIEIIVVDDGSIDGSGVICDDIAERDSRISVFHLSNGGVARARNYGMDKAKGEYIAFVDSDDIVADDFIEQAVLAIQNAEYVSGAFQTISEKSKTTNVDYMSDFSDRVVCIEYLKKMSGYQAGAYWGANWGKLFRAGIIREHEIRFESEVGFAEDYRFNLEYLKYVNTVSLIHVPVYYYRVDTGESLSKKRRDLTVFWKEYLELYHRCEAVYRAHGIFDEVKINLASFLIEAYVAVIRHGIYYKKMSLTDAIVMCQKLDSVPEIREAASFYRKMTGRTHHYANMIYHHGGKMVAITLKIFKMIKS